MRFASRKALSLVVVVVSMGPSASSQSRNERDEAIKLRTDLVLLEADVLDKKTGQAIEGLKREDFTLYEDGVKQVITHFSQNKLPLSVVILLDVSGSVWPYIQELREAALSSLQKLKTEDEVALMVFAGSARLVEHFTKDKAQVARFIGAVGGSDLEGGTNTNEAVFQAASYLKSASSSENRRVIVAITDDISTLKAPTAHTEAETVRELLESGGIVCGMFFDSIYRTRQDAFLNPSVPQATLINAAAGLVNAHVERTGGVSVEVKKGNLTTKFTELIARLRTRYSLGYVSLNEKRDGKIRAIRLKVSPEIDKREKGVAVITRKGYYPQSKKTN
jgi:VWFA-related protein